VKQPRLRPLHPEASMSEPKLAAFWRLTSDEILESLRPGGPGALKVKPDGTVMDGHHRLHVLRERGIDVDALPREALPAGESEVTNEG
jgi:hypothetical protein